jgi:CCR4-NOT transcription complex subunit 4
MFLHEPGDDSESFTRQDLSSMNVISTQQPSQSQRSQPPQHAPQPIASATAQMDRQDSNEGSSTQGNDRPALPSTASWANKPPTRRLSQATASSGASPAIRPAKVESQPTEPQQQPSAGKGKQKASETPSATSTPQPKTPEQPPAPEPASTEEPKSATCDLDNVFKTVATSDYAFCFSASHLSEDDQKIIALMPPLFDPNGGAKRRAMKERERQRQEAEAQAVLQAVAPPAVETDETTEGGSLQLGGEPEERQEVSLGRSGQHAAIAPPSQQNPGAGLGLGQNFGLGESFANLGLDGRGLTSQHQQAFMQRIKADPQAASLLSAFQGGQQSQQGLGHGSMNTAPAHARQTSRYSFANDSGTATTNVKPVPNPNLMKQQSAMLPQNSNFTQTGQPQGLGGNQFYGSNVHGPPPGLKATGTPPVSGGGMFGQGHGFTTSGGLGYGAAGAGRNANEEMMRDLLRSRGGNASGNQISEAAKRELLFPYNQSHSSSSTPAPAPGLISLPFGPQSYQDSASQKQKKKGKKHRHANTSSSGGGGLVDVADPSILQARLHQGGAAMVGQGVYSGQGQGGFSSMYSGGYGRW